MNSDVPGSGAARAARIATDVARAAAGAWLAIVLTDLCRALAADADPAVGVSLARVLWASAGYAALLAAPFAAGAALLAHLGGRLARGGGLRTALAPLPLAIALGSAAALIADGLLAGRGFRKFPLAFALLGRMRWVSTGGAWVAGLVLAPWFRRATDDARPRRGAFAAALAGLSLAIVAVCGFADDRLYPENYPLAHAASRFCAALAGAGSLIAVLGARRRGRGETIAIVAVIGGSLLAFVVEPLRDRPASREFALTETIGLRLALARLGPRVAAPAPVAEEPPAASNADTSRPAPFDAAALDAALPDRRRFNVVWITIDAWRADSVDLDLMGAPVMPALRAYAADAARFTAAWTPCPATAQAFASAFTGLEPPATDVDQAMADRGEILSHRTDVVLAERLQKAGRKTEAIVGFFDWLMQEAFPHLKQGFERWNADLEPLAGHNDAERVASAALRALDRLAPKPFFLWTHFFDAHDPYRPRDARYGSGPYERYCGVLRETDDQLARLFARLRAPDLAPRTIVVLFGDHGEAFGKRGPLFHGSALTEEQIAVPLVVFVPGLKPRVVADPVTLVDLAPTTLELLALGRPPMHGRSLAPLLMGRDDLFPRRPVYSELVGPDRRMEHRKFAVRDGAAKYVLDELSGVETLRDLAADPREKSNRIEADPDVASRMRRLLATTRVRAAIPP